MTRTGEKIFGVVAIVAGLVLAILAGIEAHIPPVVLLVITVVVIGWVVFYFRIVRPSVSRRRPRHGANCETE